MQVVSRDVIWLLSQTRVIFSDDGAGAFRDSRPVALAAWHPPVVLRHVTAHYCHRRRGGRTILLVSSSRGPDRICSWSPYQTGRDLMAKLLFVMTATSYWTLKEGTRHPTGYWAEEFAAPYRALTGAGHEVVVASPGGVVPYVDAMSLRPAMAGSAQIALDLEEIIRSAEELRRPIELADARLDDYDAVYYPGGHGPMEDMWQNADSGRLLTAALASGKPLAIVCHAP